MAVTLRKKFHGKEVEVVKAVQELGIDDTMLAYGCRHRKTFMSWLKDHTGDNWKALTPLDRLPGGDIAKVRRDHRNTILDEIEIFGKDWVMQSWHFTKDVLDRFLKYDSQPFIKRLSKADRAAIDAKEALRIAKEVKRQVDTFLDRFLIVDSERRAERHTVIELQEAYSSFTDSVSGQLGQGMTQFFKVMLEQGIKVDNLLPSAEKPNLSIKSLIEQGGKHPKQQEEQSPLALTTKRNELKEVYLSAHPLAKERATPRH